MGLKEYLEKKRVVLADGAMGTLLSERGLLPGQAPELLNLSKPETVKGVHRDYLAAGSEIILTNTFGANPFKLSRLGLAKKMEEINRKAVAIAQQARGNLPALIAGDLGPSGELLAPLGSLSAEELAAGYRQVIAVLADSGCDFFLLETFSSIEEARIVTEAVAEKSSLPVVASFTFSPGKRGPRTLLGESPEEVAEALGAGVSGLGTNCGTGPEEAARVISQFKSRTGIPLWAKPNAGLPQLSGGKTVFPLGPEEMAAKIGGLVEAGAVIIGGCCGTTPEHIAAFKKALVNLQL